MILHHPRQIVDLREPAEVKLEPCELDGSQWTNFVIRNTVVASLEKRPGYCDRGHWWVKCCLPGLDNADGFPRYYMSETAAKLETIMWLNWRLWKKRVI
jgi:hypothetical protein